MPEPESNQQRVESESRKRILLVEDDKALRRYLEVTLQRAGYDLVLAADGLEAMKLLAAEPIDLVVTDEMMPNLSGHELCRFVRNSPQLSHLPIVLLSGFERKDVGDESTLADAFLPKPVSADDLVECVAKLVRE